MAYWKIQTNGYSNTGPNLVAVGNALRAIMGGTATAISDLSSYSDVINIGASYKVGTDATSGIYSVGSMASYSSSSSSNWYFDFVTTKYPYSKNQTSGYDPSTKLQLRCKSDYGFRWNVLDSASTVRTPYGNTSHTWTSSTSNSYGVISYLMSSMEIHIIRNDTTLFLAIHKSSDTNAAKDVGVVCMADHEYDSALDPYMHSQNVKWYPGSTMWSYVKDSLLEDNNSAAGTSNSHWYGIFRHEYLDAAGTNNRTANINDTTNYHYGGENDLQHYYPQWYPYAQMGIQSTQVASGEIHQLIPMTYQGNNNYSVSNGYGDPRIARIMNVYRTTDNQTHGERFQHGSDYYRVIRCFKTGDDDRGASLRDGCMAFPENNIAF